MNTVSAKILLLSFLSFPPLSFAKSKKKVKSSSSSSTETASSVSSEESPVPLTEGQRGPNPGASVETTIRKKFKNPPKKSFRGDPMTAPDGESKPQPLDGSRE